MTKSRDSHHGTLSYITIRKYMIGILKLRDGMKGVKGINLFEKGLFGGEVTLNTAKRINDYLQCLQS